MNTKSIAPCGVNCDLCLGFKRIKNKCIGCNNIGNKPYHCTVCSIKNCIEKKSNTNLLCGDCSKFPCKRIKNLDKRYSTKYGESPIQNLKKIKNIGVRKFIKLEKEKWKCKKCGQLLCVHRNICLNCNSINEFFGQQI